MFLVFTVVFPVLRILLFWQHCWTVRKSNVCKAFSQHILHHYSIKDQHCLADENSHGDEDVSVGRLGSNTMWTCR